MTYVRAIEAAGGIPVVVPPVSDRDARRLLGRLDGLVLSGGPDLAPGAYGAQPHVELGPTEPHLDRFEYAIAREAVRLRLPTLGICRGAQTLNVVRGGTLHQHLPDVVGDTIAHRQVTDGRMPTHPVGDRTRQHAGRCAWSDETERELVPSPGCRPPGRRSVRVRLGARWNHRGDRGPCNSPSCLRFSGTRRLCAGFPCIWRCSKSSPASQLASQRFDGPRSAGGPAPAVHVALSTAPSARCSPFHGVFACGGPHAALSTGVCREDVDGHVTRASRHGCASPVGGVEHRRSCLWRRNRGRGDAGRPAATVGAGAADRRCARRTSRCAG